MVCSVGLCRVEGRRACVHPHELGPHVRVERNHWTVGIRPLPRRVRIEIDGGEEAGGRTCTVDPIAGRPFGGGCAEHGGEFLNT